MNDAAVVLAHDDLPAFFHSTDATSLRGQRSFLVKNVLQLMAIALAAIFAAFVDVLGPWGSILAASFFVLAVVLRLHIGSMQDDRAWYAGRAAAESVKTLAWRYSVGGQPFTTSLTENEASSLFVERLKAITDMIEHLPVAPDDRERQQITDGMRRLRNADLGSRIDAYAQGRLEDQWRWYGRNAGRNYRRARAWSSGVLAIEVVGVLLAIGLVAGLVEPDFLGVVSACAACLMAWIGLKQHNSLAASYGIATNELSQVLTLARDGMSEAQWSAFVDEAEEAISREHTLWSASRIDPSW